MSRDHRRNGGGNGEFGFQVRHNLEERGGSGAGAGRLLRRRLSLFILIPFIGVVQSI